MNKAPHKNVRKIRFATSASLIDGHDASINIMRRILQSSGAEVIHLNHNRSVDELVDAVRYCSLGEITKALLEVGGSTGAICGRFLLSFRSVGPIRRTAPRKRRFDASRDDEVCGSEMTE